ncbi:MAG TPA: hypothetical protein VD884_01310 [Ohtaekwangia sp.]|nr:hypothetical protein [Ohtaekwangia sp.]
MRDGFSMDVKDSVSKRVGLLCSNPDCRVLTMGPNTDVSKATNLGVAAHITAASEGGPRFDKSISSDARKSILNAIWLCQSCAKLIDSDPIKYTVHLITKWKITAEEYAESLLNKKIPVGEDYSKIYALMPELIKEIDTDLQAHPIFREFILLQKGWSYNTGGREILVYFYDDHLDLDAKIKLLENNGLIRDITYNNTKRYVLEEHFVRSLKEWISPQL